MKFPEAVARPTKRAEPFQPKRQPEAIRKEIQGIEQDRDRYVAGLKEQLEFARKRKLPTQDLESKLEKAPDLYDTSIADLRAELQEVEDYFAAKEAQQRELQKAQAAETDQALKSQLRTAWLAGGGDPDEFEKEFPDLKRAELVKRTQENAARTDDGFRQDVGKLF